MQSTQSYTHWLVRHCFINISVLLSSGGYCTSRAQYTFPFGPGPDGLSPAPHAQVHEPHQKYLRRPMSSIPSSALHGVVVTAVLALALKLLLIPSPHSTDLEVHRHWKALTHNLPLSRWYTDISSQWTLDYPPLFAFFESILATALAPLDPALVTLSNHNYAHPRTLTLLRLSVIALDPLLAFAVHAYISALYPLSLRSSSLSQTFTAAVLTLLCPALILVDNVHFQYNALPLSLLLFSLSSLHRHAIRPASFLFTLTLNAKHTLLPLAPTLAVYILTLLRRHLHPAATIIHSALLILCTLLLLWLPFYHAGGLSLLLHIKYRLLPFHRGLLHANWAPNVWAVCAVLDRLLARLGFTLREPDGATTTGIIGARRPFATLPNPSPAICTLLSLIVTLPTLIGLFRYPAGLRFARAVVLAALASFLFGWHVHEKNILVALLPLAALAPSGRSTAFALLLLAPAAHLAILNLVVHSPAALFARCFVVFYQVFAHGALCHLLNESQRIIALLYAVGAIIVETYGWAFHPLLFGTRMPFLPNILVAVYAFVGVLASFVVLLEKESSQRIAGDAKMFENAENSPVGGLKRD